MVIALYFIQLRININCENSCSFACMVYIHIVYLQYKNTEIMLKRRTYKAQLKLMNAEQLEKWISKRLDLLLSVGDDGGATPLLTKIIYAQELLKKITVEK